MNRETLAAIDIGSNAIRLQISYIEESGSKVEFKRAVFVRVPIRLGEDVFTSGSIGEEKREKMSEAMASFAALMKTFNVRAYRACATSAMREAANGKEILEDISARNGIDIEIISGREEAETIFEAGDIAGLMDSDHTYLYIDVGGGSTEITVYANRQMVFSESFPIGTVRMLSGAVGKEELRVFKAWLEKEALPYAPVAIIGSGGNINKIQRLLGKKDRELLRHVELRLLYEQLKEMTYEQRMKNMGMKDYRADVILPALKIFISAGRACHIDKIIVPRLGLADGIINQLYRKGK
ncbi:MAG: hypothetical protein R3Y61_00660 [Rikenellaceae bacterium]